MSHEGVVESASRKSFNLAMMLAFQEHSTATHLLIDKENRCMVFFWHEPEPAWKAEKLRVPMKLPKVIDYAWEWLRKELNASSHKTTDSYCDEMWVGGFRVKFGGEFRLYWKRSHKFGPEDGSSYGICAVYPAWHEIHK